MAVFQDSAIAPEIHSPQCISPTPPVLDVSLMDMRELTLLEGFFESVAMSALNMCNQPRYDVSYAGEAANYADGFWEYLNRMWDSVTGEIEARAPVNRHDARLRADVLIRHFIQCDDYEGIAALAASMLDSSGDE